MNCKITHRSAPQPIRGIMLVECLVYISIFALLTGLAFSAYYRCLDNYRDLRRNAEAVAKVLQVGEQWRQDVRSSTATPLYEREEDEERLRLPQLNGEITYGFCRGIIWRKANTGVAPQTVLASVKKSQVIKESHGPIGVWRWEIELDTRQKTVRMVPLFTFQAVAQWPGKL
jgi:hypothetical protein